MLGTSNRVTKAIDDIRERLVTLDADKVASLEESMAVTFEDHFAFQQTQAQAHASGRLTTDEAQIMYVALGELGSSENGGWAPETDLATKIVVTKLVGELIGVR